MGVYGEILHLLSNLVETSLQSSSKMSIERSCPRAKCKRCTSIALINFRNLNAKFENLDADSEVKVTGDNIFVFMEKSYPKAYLCKI